ncbi:PQQ-binding-like beta-propeller repeat protein [Streptomyces sp. NPDC021020]|uniref:outer membrane protein assembly factor BamB family protein n=1 Tax=Streptomyces sp. NPDC021020 TaxID=3365109 RepID=UPI0037A8C5CA
MAPAWTRTRSAVVGVVVIALAAGGWLWARHGDGDGGYHEQITAAAGAYPTAPGTAPPDAPARVLPKTSGTYGFAGALSVDRAQGHGRDGVTAHDLRTGSAYWTYARDGESLGLVATGDENAAAGTDSGGTVAMWWQDGLVVAVDARTGKPRWRSRLTAAWAHGYRGHRGLSLAGGLVLAAGEDTLTAYDATAGGHAWTARPPQGCTFQDGAVLTMTHAVTAEVRCGDRGKRVGYDPGSGAVRWQVADGGTAPLRPADDHTLVTSLDGSGLTSGKVVDVSGARPVEHAWRTPDGHPSVGAGAGIVLCQSPGVAVLEGFGLTDPKQHWSYPAAKGTRFGGALQAGDRVYVVQQPERAYDTNAKPVPADSYRATLLVLDARTGQRLGATALPPFPIGSGLPPQVTRSLQPWHAAGGVVGVVWGTDGIALPPADAVVLGQ